VEEQHSSIAPAMAAATCGLAVLLLAGACASGAAKGTSGAPLPSVTATRQQGRPVLSAASSASAGAIVVDSTGHTLYRFDKDTAKPSRVTCAGACEKKWPPVLAGDETSTKGVDLGLVGRVKRPDGRWQLTLAGWPLYRYAGDRRRGDVKGQNVGGVWFAVAPDGKKAGAAGASGPGGGAGAADTSQTAWGPLSAADRALLVELRQVGLWTRTTVDQAAQVATAGRVKAAAAGVAKAQAALDVQATSAGARLRVALPARLNDGRQAGRDELKNDLNQWTAELSDASGREYDALLVNRLRAAYARVLTDLALARAETRNSLVRAFAQRAVDTVMNDMTLLEHTGLVDGSALAQSPASPQRSTSSLSYAEP
jgi:predicted lipoprotein with Yx(FWY)xxD motif